ncbi:MAG: oxygen-independent coproporphyrinogen III oxidase-like protein [Burkholderiales bacterium]|nr:oxygen-independent coproporphyrinogen III oxidase-like protein [Burkholderiales bacterium]
MSPPSGPRRPLQPIAIPVVPAPEPGQAPRGAATSALSAPAAATKEGTLLALPPLSLYVHLPWCLRKCPYCDFNSHESAPPDAALQGRYRQALVRDLEAALPQVWGRTVHSIFIGGGTPSLFEPEQVEALLADIRARLRLEPACEITLEANPGTFEAQRFAAYARAGVTRLSVGVQSFNDRALAALGRVHDGAQARAAVQEAAASFDTWNLDLMYALPGQTAGDLERDLDTALALQPPHLSIYHLTIEPNTRFALQPPSQLPDDDSAYAMLDRIIERTAAAGLARYEVSAFSRPGHRCTHNLNYWRFGDYLGIGAGAHSKLSFPDRLVRQVRWREPRAYMEAAERGQAVSNEHPIAIDDRPFEFMLNGLRLIEGVSLRAFHERTGLNAAVLEPALRRAVAQGLLVQDGLQLQPSARGLDFLSDLQALFLPA